MRQYNVRNSTYNQIFKRFITYNCISVHIHNFSNNGVSMSLEDSVIEALREDGYIVAYGVNDALQDMDSGDIKEYLEDIGFMVQEDETTLSDFSDDDIIDHLSEKGHTVLNDKDPEITIRFNDSLGDKEDVLKELERLKEKGIIYDWD